MLAANNDRLPPMWTPQRFLTYLRWAWLIEGGAQDRLAPVVPAELVVRATCGSPRTRALAAATPAEARSTITTEGA